MGAAGISFLGLAMLASFIIVIGLAVVLLAARRRPPVTRPSCGQCRYPIEGLEGTTCPECGSDLKVVGILTPSMGARLNRSVLAILFAMAWTFLLPLPAMVVSALVLRALPTSYDNQATITMTPTRGAYGTMNVVLDGKDMPRGGLYERAELTAVGGVRTSTAPLGLDLESSEDELTDAIGAWLEVEGVGGEGADVEARRLAQHLQVLATSQAFTTGTAFTGASMSTRTITRRQPWLVGITVIVWILVWAGGVVFIVRWARAGRSRVDEAA